jgi:hypothetical protein
MWLWPKTVCCDAASCLARNVYPYSRQKALRYFGDWDDLLVTPSPHLSPLIRWNVFLTLYGIIVPQIYLSVAPASLL